LSAARQNLDPGVVAADGVAVEFAGLAAHHAGVGDGAVAAEDCDVRRP
jgi:hypothetical protein